MLGVRFRFISCLLLASRRCVGVSTAQCAARSPLRSRPRRIRLRSSRRRHRHRSLPPAARIDSCRHSPAAGSAPRPRRTSTSPRSSSSTKRLKPPPLSAAAQLIKQHIEWRKLRNRDAERSAGEGGAGGQRKRRKPIWKSAETARALLRSFSCRMIALAPPEMKPYLLERKGACAGRVAAAARPTRDRTADAHTGKGKRASARRVSAPPRRCFPYPLALSVEAPGLGLPSP